MMLTMRASSHTGMHARHMLEKTPPTCASILYGLAWPKAARHGAGTNMVAPSTPAPHPTRRRRVTLPLYQNSCELSWSFKSLAIVSFLSLDFLLSDLEAFLCLSRLWIAAATPPGSQPAN